MNKRNLWLLRLGVILAGALLLYYAPNILTNPEGHLLDESCSSCHLAQGSITPSNAASLISSQEKLCARCHPKAIKNSHPSGFIPSQQPPSSFPLDWKGDLTCSTCHRIHSNEPGLPRITERGKAYCLACHQESFFKEMPDEGISLLFGHLDFDNLPEDLEIDGVSLNCMTCHDKLEGALKVSVDQRMIIRHGSGSTNHPIGSRYEDAVAFGGYHPVEHLSKQIQLPEGRVGCISCHMSYSKNHGALVTTNSGSDLCFQCHDI